MWRAHLVITDRFAIKVEEIIPEGFEVSSAPDICRVEDSYLDMKGRTLNPLKTAELRLV